VFVCAVLSPNSINLLAQQALPGVLKVEISLNSLILFAVPLNISSSPVILALSPSSGYVGSVITVSGANFIVGFSCDAQIVPSSGAAVNASKCLIRSMTLLTVAIGLGTTPGNSSVRVAFGVGEAVAHNLSVALQVYGPPEISGVHPISGYVGSVITVSGANFIVGYSCDAQIVPSSGAAVNASKCLIRSTTLLTVAIGLGTTPGNSSLRVAFGVGEAVAHNLSVALQVYGPPEISGVHPISGYVGSVITVSGANFIVGYSCDAQIVPSSGAAVNASKCLIRSMTLLTVAIGLGTTPGNSSVRVAFGVGEAVAHNLNVALLVLGAISNSSSTGDMPSSGSYTVQISGSNFGIFPREIAVSYMKSTSQNNFSGTSCQSSSWISDSSLRCRAPSGTGKGLVVLATLASFIERIGDNSNFQTPFPTTVSSNLSATSGSFLTVISGFNYGNSGASVRVSSGKMPGPSLSASASAAGSWISDSSVVCKLASGTSSGLPLIVTVSNQTSRILPAVSYASPIVSAINRSYSFAANFPTTGSVSSHIYGFGFASFGSSPHASMGLSTLHSTAWISFSNLQCRSSSRAGLMTDIIASVGLLRSFKTGLNASVDMPLATALLNSSNIPSTGSIVLQLLGNGFAPFGTSPAARLGLSSFQHTVWSSNSNLLCRAFSGGGSVTNLVVSVDQAVVSNIGIRLSYNAPHIDRVFPSFADDQGGVLITVEGSNFGDSGYNYTSVSFEGVPARTVQVVSSTSVLLSTPLFCLSKNPIYNSSILISVNNVSVSAIFEFRFAIVYQASVVPSQGSNPIIVSEANPIAVNVQCSDACLSSVRQNICKRLSMNVRNSVGATVRDVNFTNPSSSNFVSVPFNLSLGSYRANILVLPPNHLIGSMPIVIDVFPSTATMLSSGSSISLPLSPNMTVSAFALGVRFQQISVSQSYASAISLTTRDWSIRVVYFNSTNSFGIQSSSGRRLLQTQVSCIAVCTVVLSVDPSPAIASLYVNGALTQNVSFTGSSSNSAQIAIGGPGFSGIPLVASFIPASSPQSVLAGNQASNEFVWSLSNIIGGAVPVSQPSNLTCCPLAPSGSINGNVTIVPLTPVSFKAVLSTVNPTSGPISGRSVTVTGAGFVNSNMMRCKFQLMHSNVLQSDITSASFVDPFTVICFASQQITYGVAFVQVSNDGFIWSDANTAVTFVYLSSVLSLQSISSNASSCLNISDVSLISFWFLLNATSSTGNSASRFVSSPSLAIAAKVSNNILSIHLNSTSCGFFGNISSLSLNEWHFLSFDCRNPKSVSLIIDSAVVSNSSVHTFPQSASSTNGSVIFSGIGGELLLSSVRVRTSDASFEWPLFSGGNSSTESSRIGHCEMSITSDWILMNSPSVIPSVYSVAPSSLSFLSDVARVSGNFFAPFSQSLACVCFKDNGIDPESLHLIAQGRKIDPSTVECRLPLGRSGSYRVFVTNDIWAFRRQSSCFFNSRNCDRAALSVNSSTVLFAPELPLITNGSLAATVSCSGTCSKIAITFWLFLSKFSNQSIVSTHIVVNSFVRICSAGQDASRYFYVSNTTDCSKKNGRVSSAAVDMWHFVTLEMDESNTTTFSVDYLGDQSIQTFFSFKNEIDIVFNSDIPQAFAGISVLSMSNTTSSILNRDAISRLRMTSGSIYSSSARLIAYWAGQELTGNQTFLSSVGPAFQSLLLTGSFTYTELSVPFQNPVLSSTSTSPGIVPNNLGTAVTVQGRDFSFSPYLSCILASQQCGVNSSLFPLNLSFLGCAVQATFLSRNQVLCAVPSTFSQSKILVYVTNSLPGLTSSSTMMRVMESVVQLDSFGAVTAANLGSIISSSSRTFSFWLFLGNDYQDRQFFSVNISCSSVKKATFSLALQSNNNLRAHFSTFPDFANSSNTTTFELQAQPQQPTLLKNNWHFVAVTFQVNGILMYVDNTDYTFLQSNFSCPNITNCTSATLEFTPNNNATQGTGSFLFSQFRIFNSSFDPAFRGFIEESEKAATNFRLATENDLSRGGITSIVSWNFNLCNCPSFNTYASSSNVDAVLTSNSRVSIVFRSVPWLLPQVDSFSPNIGYCPPFPFSYVVQLTQFRFSRSKTEILVQGFGFANSNFLRFSISTSTDTTSLLFITIGTGFSFIDDFSMNLTAFERVSSLQRPSAAHLLCIFPIFF
jgi:hypothetical protein